MTDVVLQPAEIQPVPVEELSTNAEALARAERLKKVVGWICEALHEQSETVIDIETMERLRKFRPDYLGISGLRDSNTFLEERTIVECVKRENVRLAQRMYDSLVYPLGSKPEPIVLVDSGNLNFPTSVDHA